MSEKHKKVCRSLNYFEYFLVFVPTISSVSISAFASLVVGSADITSSALGLEICAITTVLKK